MLGWGGSWRGAGDEGEADAPERESAESETDMGNLQCLRLQPAIRQQWGLLLPTCVLEVDSVLPAGPAASFTLWWLR
ncbi:hypothetical protein DB346_07225 [Verrucomicrobia bacterium LW23]|nr:hypothetical protein DB346_07225 [Verrucomicrobia bacterium LW23]